MSQQPNDPDSESSPIYSGTDANVAVGEYAAVLSLPDHNLSRKMVPVASWFVT